MTETPLDPKQDALIIQLLQCTTVSEAAKAADVTTSTVYRWLKEEQFSKAYRDAQKRLFDVAMGHLQGGTSEAVRTLREIMTSTTAPETARVTAARTVLDFARQHIGQQEIEDRIAALEAGMKNEK